MKNFFKDLSLPLLLFTIISVLLSLLLLDLHEDITEEDVNQAYIDGYKDAAYEIYDEYHLELDCTHER